MLRQTHHVTKEQTSDCLFAHETLGPVYHRLLLYICALSKSLPKGGLSYQLLSYLILLSHILDTPLVTTCT